MFIHILFGFSKDINFIAFESGFKNFSQTKVSLLLVFPTDKL